jgi:SAM-dependent methyltransferase
MTPAQQFNDEQLKRWNGEDGEHWATQQEQMDRTLEPVIAPLLAFAAPQPGTTVLDVGCGCGATLIELVRAVGPTGKVVGIDISEPMLGRARERLREYPNTSCRLGDAATAKLDDIQAELIFSRFGVMFFGDPVAAFSNLRNALRPGGRVRFACWRPIQENPWLQVPLHAVYEHVPRMPKPDPEEPGPFSFSDIDRVTRILKSAGFSTPRFEPLEIQMNLAPNGTLDDAVGQATNMGPARRALEGHPDSVREAAVEAVRRALTPWVSPNGVKLPASIWLVAAERA